MSIDGPRVYYPHGGRRFLLHWWTYDDRGHVILATTERSLQAVAARVFDENTDAEIKALCEIDIVAPPVLLCALASGHVLQARIFAFHREVIRYLRDAAEAGRPLPSPFAVCSDYLPDEEVGMDVTEWARSTHYSCTHCVDTIQLVGLTPLELYERYHMAWRKLHPEAEYINPKLVESRAPRALDNEPLWCACAEFGHHASGIVLNALDLDEAPSFLRLFDRVLFFFRRVRDLEPATMQATLDALKIAAEERRARLEQERIATRKCNDDAVIEETIAFFLRE